jgi:ferric-dicitrate binding protein FerR (iron transport regulator)
MARLLALLLLAASCPASAARLVHAVGPVSIETKGKPAPAKTGAELPSGAVLVAGEGATAIVALDDGSRLKMRAGTRLKVEVSPKNGQVDAFLESGSVFARVTEGLKRRFQVRTPSAVAAVRGTEFFTAYGRDGRKGRDLWVCVGKGAVEVSASDAKKPMTIKQGEGILLPGGRDLTKPQAYDWTKSLNWNMDPEKGAVEDKTKLEGAYADLRDQDYR